MSNPELREYNKTLQNIWRAGLRRDAQKAIWVGLAIAIIGSIGVVATQSGDNIGYGIVGFVVLGGIIVLYNLIKLYHNRNR